MSVDLYKFVPVVVTFQSHNGIRNVKLKLIKVAFFFFFYAIQFKLGSIVTYLVKITYIRLFVFAGMQGRSNIDAFPAWAKILM